MKGQGKENGLFRRKGFCVGTLMLTQALYVAPLLATYVSENSNNLHLHGALVAEPCIIAPADEEIQLDFGTIIEKSLYLYTRTPGQSFKIRLTECDLSLGKTVKITFKGTENPALSGLLAIDAGSQASGIAIGFESTNAEPMPLNKESSKFLLQKGSNTLQVKAYVQGEPKAIQNKNIGRGTFSAVSTFYLEYE